jgi:hypothetical protein
MKIHGPTQKPLGMENGSILQIMPVYHLLVDYFNTGKSYVTQAKHALVDSQGNAVRDGSPCTSD